MSRQLLITLGVAVVIVGALLFTTVSVNQKHLLTLEGSITNVRVEPLNQGSSLVILDFTATNPSEVPFEMKEVGVERIDGTPVRGDVVGKAETVRFMEYGKLAQVGPPTGMGDKIKAKEKASRMISARFDNPPPGLETGTYRIAFLDY